MRQIMCFLSVLAGLLGGCARQEQTVSGVPVCLSGRSVEQIMEAAQAVLTGMHFEIEKYDSEARYIRTRPLSGAQFFEVWRQDNASGASAIQANMYSLRRIAELDITAQEAATCVQCRVRVLRLSVPEEPIEGTRRMAGGITEGSSGMQTLEIDPDKLKRIEWLDAGDDPSLENRILERIEKRIQEETKR